MEEDSDLETTIRQESLASFLEEMKKFTLEFLRREQIEFGKREARDRNASALLDQRMEVGEVTESLHQEGKLK